MYLTFYSLLKFCEKILNDMLSKFVKKWAKPELFGS